MALTSEHILAKAGLKRTACRQGIIESVMEAGCALSEAEIRDNLGAKFDRTTFYRSFITLVDSRVLHKVVVDSHIVKYALAQSNTLVQHHAHFYCHQCQKVQCLQSVAVNNPLLPDGFEGASAEFVIKGTCNLCHNNNA
jgi:Fur family transcriptional regulator, ferric uptake regulator